MRLFYIFLIVFFFSFFSESQAIVIEYKEPDSNLISYIDTGVDDHTESDSLTATTDSTSIQTKDNDLDKHSLEKFSYNISRANYIINKIDVLDKFDRALEKYILQDTYLDLYEFTTLEDIDILRKNVGMLYNNVIEARRKELLEAMFLDVEIKREETEGVFLVDNSNLDDEERSKREILSIQEYFDDLEKRRTNQFLNAKQKLGLFFSFSNIYLNHENYEVSRNFYNESKKLKSHGQIQAGLITLGFDEFINPFNVFITTALAGNYVETRSKYTDFFPSFNMELGISQFFQFNGYDDFGLELPLNLGMGVEISKHRPLYYVKMNLALWHFGLFNSNSTKMTYGWSFPKIIKWIKTFTIEDVIKYYRIH